MFDPASIIVASATESLLAERIRNAIAAIIATGKGVSNAPDDVREVLKAAGCEPKAANYGESLMRTVMMTHYNEQSEAAFAGHADAFPVWRYDAILDSRVRPAHAVHHGKYYPAYVRFDDIRGRTAAEVIQCRCVRTPIALQSWRRLVAAGARIADGYPEPILTPPRAQVSLTQDALAMLPPDLTGSGTLADLLRTPRGRQWVVRNKAALRAALLPQVSGEAVPRTLPIPNRVK